MHFNGISVEYHNWIWPVPYFPAKIIKKTLVTPNVLYPYIYQNEFPTNVPIFRITVDLRNAHAIK